MLRSAKMNVQVMAGGGSSSSMLAVAEALVSTGAARTVLCLHSDKVGSLPRQAGTDLFASWYSKTRENGRCAFPN